VDGVPDAEPLRAAAEEFIESVRYGTEPRTSGRKSLPVLALLEAAERATEGERPSA
jgi:predicted dehydrogenase